MEKTGRRLIVRQANVADLSAVTAVVNEGAAELGRLDIVVANAAVGSNPAPLADISAEEWQNVLATNLTGVFNTAKATVPQLVAGGRGGSVILISSSMSLRARPNMAAYSSAKTGLIGLMQALAMELCEHSIRVNSVHPTTVRTPLLINDVCYRLFRPDLDNPTLEDVEPLYRSINLLPRAVHRTGGRRQRRGFPGLRRSPLHHGCPAPRGRRIRTQVIPTGCVIPRDTRGV